MKHACPSLFATWYVSCVVKEQIFEPAKDTRMLLLLLRVKDFGARVRQVERDSNSNARQNTN